MSESLFIRWRCTLNESISPEPVLVQDGNHRILQVTVIVEVDASINRRSIPLPDGPVLATVKKLDQECARLQIDLFLVVVEIRILRLHPLLNFRLIISIKLEAVGVHFEADDQVRPMFGLLIPQKSHPGNDGFFDYGIDHAGVYQADGPHDLKGAILLEIAPVAIVILNREFLIAETRGKKNHHKKGSEVPHSNSVMSIQTKIYPT